MADKPEKRIYLDSSKRPTKLTPEIIEQFCQLLEAGMPLDGACDYLGVAPQTFWTWIRKGNLFLQDPEIQPKFRIYGDFVLNTRRASAQYRLDVTRRLHTSTTWSRELAILERRDRKNFGRFDFSAGQGVEQLDPDDRFS